MESGLTWNYLWKN